MLRNLQRMSHSPSRKTKRVRDNPRHFVKSHKMSLFDSLVFVVSLFCSMQVKVAQHKSGEYHVKLTRSKETLASEHATKHYEVEIHPNHVSLERNKITGV